MKKKKMTSLHLSKDKVIAAFIASNLFRGKVNNNYLIRNQDVLIVTKTKREEESSS